MDLAYTTVGYATNGIDLGSTTIGKHNFTDLSAG